MLNEILNYLSILWKLIWKNKILRTRLIFSIVSFPVFVFIVIFIFEYLGVQPPITYILIFLSGLFYHFSVTIFSISAVYSYSKFLINNRILLKVFIFIYFLGLLASVMNCTIIVQLNSIHYLPFEVGQIYFAFFMSNFVFAPLGFWVSSFDFVKIDLFRSNVDIYQPRPIYLAAAIVFLLVFSLLLDARAEFNWSFNSIFIVMTGLIVVIGVFLKRIVKIIYVNYQNSIAE
jgi:hypothetical protein